MPIVNNVDPSLLNSTELRNAFAILINLSDEKFNRVKEALNLSMPGVLGPTTLQAFARFCARAGLDLSSEGVRRFKTEHPPLSPDLPLGPKTAEVYYEALGFERDVDEATPWMTFAKAELAARVKEFPGDPDNPRIVEYHRTTTLNASDASNDETSWCSSFVNWCMMKADIRRTKNAVARSWLNWGREIDEPVYGCVVVYWRISKTSSNGHVGFYTGETDTHILNLGGNQSDAVSIAKYAKDRVLSYRMPRDEDRLG